MGTTNQTGKDIGVYCTAIPTATPTTIPPTATPTGVSPTPTATPTLGPLKLTFAKRFAEGSWSQVDCQAGWTGASPVPIVANPLTIPQGTPQVTACYYFTNNGTESVNMVLAEDQQLGSTYLIGVHGCTTPFPLAAGASTYCKLGPLNSSSLTPGFLLSGARWRVSNLAGTVIGDITSSATLIVLGATPTPTDTTLTPTPTPTSIYNPWFQQSGGLLYSRENFTSELPPATYLVNYTTATDLNTAGLPMCGGDDILVNGNYSVNPGSIISSDPPPHVLEYSAPQSLCAQYNYDYYAQLLANFTPYPGGDILTKEDLVDGAQPLSANSDVLVKVFEDSVILQPDAVWQFKLAAGQYEKYLFLINGDLTISGATNADTSLIEIDPGAFVMFVNSGNIFIDPSVGSTTGGETALQGVYLSSQNLTVETYAPNPDKQFIGEGSFIGCSGVSLNRNLGDSNASQPAEKFIYRPDLLWSAPKTLSRPSLIWTEL